MEQWRKRSNDASFELLDAHDLKVTLTEGDYARGGRLRAAARSIPGAASIGRAQERLAVPTQLDFGSGRPGTLTAGRIVGVDLAPGQEIVDGISVEDGRGLAPGDSGRAVAVLEAAMPNFTTFPRTAAWRSRAATLCATSGPAARRSTSS